MPSDKHVTDALNRMNKAVQNKGQFTPERMGWVNVQSSNLAAVRYYGTNLYIRFTNGSTYQYFHVPLDVYVDLINAPSKGSFHHQAIKGVYDFKRVG